ATPRKVSTQGEPERHGRIEVRARDRAHEEDDPHHHQPGCRDSGRPADRAVAGGVDDGAAGTHENEEERSEELGEEASPLQVGIVEVAQAWVLEGEQRPPCGRLIRLAVLLVDHRAHPLEATASTSDNRCHSIDTHRPDRVKAALGATIHPDGRMRPPEPRRNYLQWQAKGQAGGWVERPTQRGRTTPWLP